MLYPVAPIYLTTVLGASMAWVGIIEGVAEAVSGLSKGYFGALSDARGRRRPFVTLGYGLSALSKPLPALFPSVAGLLGSRVLDRVGKGVRTAPRDALLAGYTTKENHGAVFGLHRAMDTTGAAIGPAIALLYLAYHPGHYAALFLLAFIPSSLSMLATFFVKDAAFAPSAKRPGIADSLRFWKSAPGAYRFVITWLTLFALVNASDAFLILRAREIGFSDTAAIGGYIGYNIIYALAALPAGRISDKLGRKRVVAAGFLLYGVAYACFALAGSIAAAWIGFGIYGVYAALTEGVSKAWISDLVPNERRGLAIGLQTTLASLGALVASAWTGFLWVSHAPVQVPLMVAAATAVVVGGMVWIGESGGASGGDSRGMRDEG
jgi:MFS family permease